MGQIVIFFYNLIIIVWKNKIWKVISTNNVLNTINSYHKSLKTSYWSNLIFLETLNAHGTTKYVLHTQVRTIYYKVLHCLVLVNLILYDCSVLDTKSGPAPPFLFRYVRSRFFRAIAPGLSCSRDIGQKIYQSRVLSVCTDLIARPQFSRF